MKKLILFVLISISFYSCDDPISYQNGTKLVFEGKLVDKNNIPIANIPLKIAYSKNGSYGGFLFPGSSSDYTEPGFGFSDENGNFKLFVYSATNEDEMALIINEEQFFGFQKKSIVNINDSNFIDYKLNFNTIVLHKTDAIVNLNVIFERITSPDTIIVKNVEFIGQIAVFETYFNPIESYNDYYGYYSFSSINYNVLKNQNTIVQYDLFDTTNNTSTTFIKNIIILENNVEEIIQY